MGHAEYEVTINRPIAQVFEFVQNGENNPLWRKSHLDVEKVTGGPPGVGTNFKQGLKGPLGRRIDGDDEITQSHPSELVVFKVKSGPVRPTTGIYEFKDLAGSTAVKFTLDYQLKGLLRLFAPLINRQMRQEVDDLEDLKRHLETSALEPRRLIHINV